MDEEILKPLTNLQGLTDFVYQPVYSNLNSSTEMIEEFLDCPGIIDEIGLFWRISTEAWTRCGMSIACKLWQLIWFIRDIFNVMSRYLSDYIFKYPVQWWNENLEMLRDLYYTLRDQLAKFAWDPVGFLWGVITNIVSQIKSFSQNVIINLGDFIDRIWTNLYNYIKPRFDSLFKSISDWLALQWLNISTTFTNIVHEITDPIGQTFSWLWSKMEAYWNTIKIWFDSKFILPFIQLITKINLGFEINRIYVAEFLATVKLLLTDPAGYIIKFNTAIAEHTDEKWFMAATSTYQTMGGWLENWFNFITDSLYTEFDKLKLEAPSDALDPKTYFKALMGSGARVLGGMTGLSVLVSALSKAQLGPIAAVLYDMSGYKYITGAIIGGLTTAAFVQPLKYFYNEKFRPYLPEWKVVLDLFNRGIITEERLRWFAKWYGFRDDDVWYFERYVATPISLLRQADMVTWDTSSKSDLLEEMRFAGLEEAGVVQYLPALWLKGKSMWLTRMITEMMYAIRRGFALVPEMVTDITKLRAGREAISSSGHRFLPRVTWDFQRMPTTSEILAMISKWATIRLTGDGLTDEIKAEFREDLITEDVAKERLSKIVKIPALVEGELAPIKAGKRARVEPEKGKDLRKELKTVFKNCFKEGLITYERLLTEIRKANRLADEEELITARAQWEAFYDDMMDWRKIYERKLLDGIITESEFKIDLLDMGFRPLKVELMLKYDRAKKLGKAK